MASSTDYDAPRHPAVDLEENSLDELKARRAGAQSPSVDVDEVQAAEGFELPGADLSDEELDREGRADAGRRIPVFAVLPRTSPQPARRRLRQGRLPGMLLTPGCTEVGRAGWRLPD